MAENGRSALVSIGLEQLMGAVLLLHGDALLLPLQQPLSPTQAHGHGDDTDETGQEHRRHDRHEHHGLQAYYGFRFLVFYGQYGFN